MINIRVKRYKVSRTNPLRWMDGVEEP